MPVASKRRSGGRVPTVRGLPKIVTPGTGRSMPPLRKHQMADKQKQMKFVMNLHKRKGV